MRNIFDADLRKEIALPAQNTSASTSSVDFGAAGAAVLESVELNVVIPATPSLANSQTVTATVQDSADGSNFAAISGLSTLVVTGAGGVGAAEASRRYKLPSHTRQYVRVNYAASATAGDNTGVTGYFDVLT